MRRYRSTRFEAPRGMVARRAGECATCKKPVNPGDAIVWAPAVRLAYCSEHGASLLRGVQAERSVTHYGNDLGYER